MMKIIGAVIGVAVLGVVGFTVVGGGSETPATQEKDQIVKAESPVAVQQASQVDAALLRHVDTSSELYKNFESVPSDGYDEFFIANMIHLSEGLSQLEQIALEQGADPALTEKAGAQAAKATEGIAFYKQLQKDMGLPVSYGDNMQYHGAMGADSEVYFALESLKGLSGSKLDAGLVEQLTYMRELETVIAGIGVEKTTDENVLELMSETLSFNAPILDVLNAMGGA